MADRFLPRPLAWLPVLALVGCGGGSAPTPETAATGAPLATPEDAAPPEGPLPPGVAPTAYRLSLRVDPREERFSGEVEIALRVDAPTPRIWLHGAELAVSEATLTHGESSMAGTWTPAEDVPGVAAITFDAPVPAGEARLTIRYDAPFDRKLKGLYRVDEGDEHYAFTQFEATSARYAFPSFDEPRFKTPFDTTLIVRAGDEALANTPEVARTPEDGGWVAVRFAPTKPIPTYLVAMAIGPLDIVDGPAIPGNEVRDTPIPLRGVAAKGKGGELAKAIAGTGPLLEELERYFGIPYPYAKLDIVAVPDFASGAMENVGLVTFREALLLLGDSPGAAETRAFTYVMAHELAHQWFGNLVTMPWWDDIWLNEAFATWMGHRVVDAVTPEYQARLQLLGRVHGTMARDSLASARQIRQPIETTHDIRNAFDPITYSKGGGVLSMVEAWLGNEVFRTGLQRYMERHRFGTATADDLLRALDEASGRDVAGPFRTFLFQAGVPAISVSLVCEEGATPALRLRQQRYLPLGSESVDDRTWSIPVCARYGGGAAGTDDGRACGLLTGAEGDIALEGAAGCPSWVMPNADAAGYYRFRFLDDGLYERLRAEAWPTMGPAERLAVVDALRASTRDGFLQIGALYDWLETFAADETRPIAMAPAGILRAARERLVPDALVPRVDAMGRSLYGRRMRRLGFEDKASDAPETKLLRAAMAGFLGLAVDDGATRRELDRAAKRYLGIRRGGDAPTGPHDDAIPADLVGAALAVAVEEGGAPIFDALEGMFRASGDAAFRSRALGALGHAREPALVERARALTLDPDVRGNEVTIVLQVQMGERATRDDAWSWLVANLDEVIARVPTTRTGRLPWLASNFCEENRRASVEQVFGARIEHLDGGPRNLAGALEAIHLCDSWRLAKEDQATAYFRR